MTIGTLSNLVFEVLEASDASKKIAEISLQADLRNCNSPTIIKTMELLCEKLKQKEKE